MTESLSRYIVLAKLPEPPLTLGKTAPHILRAWNDSQASKITAELYDAISSDIAHNFPVELTKTGTPTIIKMGNEELASIFVRTTNAGYEAIKKIRDVAMVVLAKSSRSYQVF